MSHVASLVEELETIVRDSCRYPDGSTGFYQCVYCSAEHYTPEVVHQPRCLTHTLQNTIKLLREGWPKEPNLEVVRAETIAVLAHYGQRTRSDNLPFIEHPAAVAGMVDEKYKAIAWLHDVLEDSDYCSAQLRAAGISRSVVEEVELLTRTTPFEYEAYIQRIVRSRNVAAMTVKLADLTHNLRPGCPESLARRYRAAKLVMEEGLTKVGAR